MVRVLSTIMMLLVVPALCLRDDIAEHMSNSAVEQTESDRVIKSHEAADGKEGPPKLPLCEEKEPCTSNKQCKICGINFECLKLKSQPWICSDLGR